VGAGLGDLKSAGYLWDLVSGRADAGTFDVRELNHALNKAKRRDNIASAGGVVFCLAVVALFLVSDLLRAFRGQLPAFGVVVFAVSVVWLTAIAGVLVGAIRRKLPGAALLVVDAHGMGLELPDHTSVSVQWTDPHLHIELHDLSRVNSSMLSVDTPYFLRAAGKLTALSQPAFDAILDQVKAHDLVDQLRPASRWFSPAGAVHHIVNNRAAS
jgi:hypothetical protein